MFCLLVVDDLKNQSSDGKSDPLLFQKVFNDTLDEYKNADALGNIEYDELYDMMTQIYKKVLKTE